MRELLWMQLPLLATGEATGGGEPPASAPASGEAPTQPPTEGASPTPETPPADNGSLVPGDAADGEKPAVEGEAGEAAPAPEKLDLSTLALPEGMKADDPALAKFADVLQDPKLSPKERAEALLGSYREAAQAVADQAATAVSDNYRKINDDWIAEVKADPVIGGAKMQESLATVAKALDAWGDGKALRRDLALTGMGNNPHFLRFVHKMATELGEGRPAQGGTPAGRKSMAEIMYPSAGDSPQT